MTESDDECEFRKMMDDMTVESKLPAREQLQHRADRNIQRRPGLITTASPRAPGSPQPETAPRSFILDFMVTVARGSGAWQLSKLAKGGVRMVNDTKKRGTTSPPSPFATRIVQSTSMTLTRESGTGKVSL